MPDATLLIVNGTARGTRYGLATDDGEVVIGRSVGTRIRIDDTEVSRQHAVVSYDGQRFELRDLKSANGTFVNGERVTAHLLTHGDSIRMGATTLRFDRLSARDESVPTQHIRFVDDSHSGQHSGIVQQVQAPPVSVVVDPPQSAGLELLQRIAELLVRPIDNVEDLMQSVLRLSVKAVGAERGCVLLKDAVGNELTPVAFYSADSDSSPGAPMTISRSITGHVLKHKSAVRTSDALHDTRFGAANSILSTGIREAICAPMRGQEELLGVVYLDSKTPLMDESSQETTPRFSDEHLRTVLAVARQCALAVEARQYHEALVKAERFAAMGQTVAVLSHHIKNILQGFGGGGYLIKAGLNDSNDDMVRQGWNIVERNQQRISQLVMDMLSFSRERVPDLQIGDVNCVCDDVMSLCQFRADENNVELEFRPGEIPEAGFDHEGIHRAVLNIVMNAIDAVAELEDGRVVVQTDFDATADVVLIAVTDNGPGIPEEQRAAVFQVFESSKGEQGTGIGLPVSRKIIREHGGRIRIEGGPGEGTRFVLSWPRGVDEVSEG